jgi:hypothetical protein
MSNYANPVLSSTTFPRERVLGDTLPGERVRDVLLVVAGAGLVGALAQFSVHLSGTPVPITGQTVAVLLVGTSLGWRRGAAALALYAAAGLIGVPWFAYGQHGYVGANFGYILGFVAAAAVCGYLAELRADRRLARRRSARRDRQGDLTRLPAVLDRRRDQVCACGRAAAQRLAAGGQAQLIPGAATGARSSGPRRGRLGHTASVLTGGRNG